MHAILKTAKKHLGQNFLIDEHIKNKICVTAEIGPHDTVLEIGPGLGALTTMMLAMGATVYAIEKDPAMIAHLEAITDPNLHLVNADFLTCDLGMLPKITKIISNIPYNISSPIIQKLIDSRHICQTVFLTTQWEFAQRLVSQHSQKTYGALTCFIQYYADVKVFFKISPNAFRPIPKVTSCFLRILFRPPKLTANNETLLFKITQAAFQQRRKKLVNALNGVINRKHLEEVLTDVGIDIKQRGEDLSLNDFIRLANAFSSLQNE